MFYTDLDVTLRKPVIQRRYYLINQYSSRFPTIHEIVVDFWTDLGKRCKIVLDPTSDMLRGEM